MNAQELQNRFTSGEKDFFGADLAGADLAGADLDEEEREILRELVAERDKGAGDGCD